MNNRNMTKWGTTTSTSIIDNVYKSSSVRLKAGSSYLGVTVDTKNGNRKSPNPQQFLKLEESCWSGSQSTTDVITKSSRSVTGVMSSSSAHGNLSGWEEAHAYNQCTSELHEKLRGSVDLSVDLAQSGQVVRMLRQAADFRRHVIAAAIFARREAKLDWRHSLRVGGGLHLQWIYGWRPLAASIHGTIGNLGQTLDNMLSVSASSQVRRVTPYVGPVPFGTPSGSVAIEARCRQVAEFRPPSGSVQNLALYTSLNPLSIGWEVLPWSFVADWFFNVGGYIRTMESAALSTSRFVSGYQTTGTRVTVSASCKQVEVSPNRQTYGSASSSTVRSTKSRTIMNSAPFPRRPRFVADLGSNRLLAGASLLSQFLKK